MDLNSLYLNILRQERLTSCKTKIIVLLVKFDFFKVVSLKFTKPFALKRNINWVFD